MNKRTIKSFLYGYRYQKLIGILRLIDLLNDKADKVFLEKKESDSDEFDDMKVYVKDQLHHYQIKSSYADNELKIVDFSSEHSLDLSKLFGTWKKLQEEFPDKEMFYHVYTTKSISPNNSLKNFIKRVTANKTTFCENPSDVYHLKRGILNHNSLKKIKDSFIADAICTADIQKFLDVLIIETNQPSSPPETPIALSMHGELDTVIRDKISNLGLSQQPNHIPDEHVSAILFNLVDRDSIASHEITKDDLEIHLKIVQNFGSIKNDIEFDESLYVDTTENLTQLSEQVIQNAGSILGITGKPGSGKTWLLTKWLKEFQNTNQDTPPIRYYSSISVTDDLDFERRVTKYQIIRNLINEIRTSYHITTENNIYAADDANIKELLSKLNEIAKEKHKVIPIVVDGLDHVDRIKERANTIKKQEETVMDFLNDIDIPSHICFMFGTQEGTHLNKLKEKFGCEKFYEIHGFNESETGSYLHKLEISTELITTENTRLIFHKTSGLPLLVRYLGQELKTGKGIEKIKNVPMTEGNVKKYYEYLWKNLENSACPRVFARYFSLLEFPIDAGFLERLKPRSERDGEKLDACIKPLTFLLRKNEKNEMSIFHDSFRVFILKETDFEDFLQTKYSKDIYDVLRRENIILNARTFRHSLKYALKSKQFDKIISSVTLKFIDKAMINLCNRYDLQNNLLYAMRAASEKGDAITLLEKSLLKRYTIERYQYLENDRFDKLITQLYPNKLLQILVTEEQLNRSLHDTVRFIGEGLSKKIELPYDNIIKIWDDAWKKTTWGQKGHLPGGISIPDYGLLLFYKGTIKDVASWVSQNSFPLEQTISIFKKIFPLSTYNNILQLQNSDNTKEYWPMLHLFAAFYYAKYDQFNIQFEEFMGTDSIPYFSEFGEFLKKSTIPPKDFAHLIHKIDLSPPGHSGSSNLEKFHKYEQQILLNAYCKNITYLEEYEIEIRQNPTVFFYKMVDLVYQVSKISQKSDSELTCVDVDELLNSLSEFINHPVEHPFDEPGHYDPNFPLYMRSIIEKVVKIIVTQSNSDIKMKLVEVVSKIATKVYFTSLTLDNMYEMILKHTNDSSFRQLLTGKISDKLDMAEIPFMIEQCFDKSQLYLQAEDKSRAKEFFEKGIRLTFSYGHHKDLFLWEIHQVSVLLGKNNYLQRAKSCLDMTEYLNVITDGYETKSLPSTIIHDTMNMHSAAGYEVALKYGADSSEFEKSVTDFVESCSDCPVLIRYFLSKTRVIYNHSNSYSSSAAFEIRCNMIQECIAKNHTNLAKLLLNDLRVETIRDLPERTESMEKRFNYLAQALGLDIIELNLNEDVENTQENCPDKTTYYSHLSPEEAIQLFDEHYGWSWGPDRSADRLLEISYLKDHEKPDQLVTKSLLRWCLKYNHEPQGAIHKFGKYLSITDQIEKLDTFYQKMDLFSKDLFRSYCLEIKRDFQFLEAIVREDDQTRTGCKYIVKQLTSRDTEVQGRAFTSIVNCIRYGSTELLGYCIEAVTDDVTDISLKAKLAAVIHSCTAFRKDVSEQLISCARYLRQANDRRLVTSGAGILRELEVS